MASCTLGDAILFLPDGSQEYETPEKPGRKNGVLSMRCDGCAGQIDTVITWFSLDCECLALCLPCMRDLVLRMEAVLLLKEN